MSKIKIFALGGLNENGKNMYVIDVNHNLFIFDAGLKYGTDKMLGVDYIIPNMDYLVKNKKNIRGVFLSHGHESNMGGISDLVQLIPEIPVYATKFTMEIVKNDLQEAGIKKANLKEIRPHSKIEFTKDLYIFPISITHSIPDSVCYVLYTKDGAIVYTGDFVFDSTMKGPYRTDIGKLAYVGKQGVLCLMSESLYADKRGYTSPNNRTTSIIRETLDQSNGRILFNIFQAQVYRIQELFNEIMHTDRNVVIMGKKMETIIQKAIDMGFIEFDKKRLTNIHHIHDENIVILISDEREKPFSNIARIIKGYDKFIKITPEDTVVFASPVYEGMEKSATKVFDDIAKMGSNLVIIPMKKYLGHHASSEDLMMMLNLMNPTYYFPVIGEYRHQVANAEAAITMGYPEDHILLCLNGDIVTFENGILKPDNEKIKVDDILVDGKTVGDIGELVLKDRELLSENGIVIVSTTLDHTTKEVLAGPEILTRGFIYVKDNIDLIKEAEKISLEVIHANSKPNYVDFNNIK